MRCQFWKRGRKRTSRLGKASGGGQRDNKRLAGARNSLESSFISYVKINLFGENSRRHVDGLVGEKGCLVWLLMWKR